MRDMSQDTDEATEAAIKEAFARGPDGIQAGVELAIARYGERLCAFVLNIVKDPSAAADVQQELWLSAFQYAATFRWESSFRGWLYLLARRAAVKSAQRGQRNDRFAGVPLSQAAESKLRAHLQTSIAAWQKDDFKQRFRELRRKLPEKDQTLLVMRSDQELPFRDIVHALAEPGEEIAPADLKTREATLMKRFQRVKQRLFQMAVEEGLIAPGGESP